MPSCSILKCINLSEELTVWFQTDIVLQEGRNIAA